MPDPIDTLRGKFRPAHRFANFGEALVQMHVKGFRSHSNTVIDFEFPIVAFCGMNGTGKSTLLQLAAVAYKNSDSKEYPSHYIRDYIRRSQLDTTPYEDDAVVRYRYAQEGSLEKTLSISRTTSWSGYRRRPTRHVSFALASLYIPKIEKRDFIFRNASTFEVQGRVSTPERVRTWTQRILGIQFDGIEGCTVAVHTQTGTLYSVSRGRVGYSEANMGYGEGRTIALVSAIEGLPPKSLVLIEEPETSLHPSAQHELGLYLLDASDKLGHQILLTTHSERILETLPDIGRIYLHRDASGIQAIPRMNTRLANSLMNAGHDKSLTVLVEDEAARVVLREILRGTDPRILQTIEIIVSGGEKRGNPVPKMKAAAELLRTSQQSIVAVCDGDQQIMKKDENGRDIPEPGVFKLPGTRPPEYEIFTNGAVTTHVGTKYGMDMGDFMAGMHNIDHHGWCRRLAEAIHKDPTALLTELAEVYAKSLPEVETRSLVDSLKAELK